MQRTPAHQHVMDLASPQPSRESLSRFREMTESEREDLLRSADLEELFLPVARRLAQEFGASFLAPEQSEKLARREAFHAELTAAMFGAAEHLANNSVTAVFIKGLSTERAYGADYHRQFDDLDAAVPDLETFWVAAEALFELGYVPLTLILARDPLTQKWTGMCNLGRESNSGLEELLEIEFKIGGLPLHWHSCLAWEQDFWDERRQLDGSSIFVPSDRQNLLVIVAETAERTSLRLRDRLDMSMLLKQAGAGQIEWLQREAARHHLNYELRRFSNEMAAVSSTDYRVQSPRLSLPFDWLKNTLPGHRSLPHAFFHDFPFASRREGLLAASRIAAASIFWDAVKSSLEQQRWLKALGYFGRRINARRRVERGWYVQFLPVAPMPRAQLTWLDESPQQLLITPIGTFLAAPIPAIYPEDLSAALERTTALSEDTA